MEAVCWAEGKEWGRAAWKSRLREVGDHLRVFRGGPLEEELFLKGSSAFCTDRCLGMGCLVTLVAEIWMLLLGTCDE